MAEVKGFDLLLLFNPPLSFLARPISIDLVFQIVANPFRERIQLILDELILQNEDR